MLTGMTSERVTGIKSESVTAFIGIRTLCKSSILLGATLTRAVWDYLPLSSTS